MDDPRNVPPIRGVSFIVLRQIPCNVMSVLAMMQEFVHPATPQELALEVESSDSICPPIVQYVSDSLEMNRYEPITFLRLSPDAETVLAILPYYLLREPSVWLGEPCVVLSRHHLPVLANRMRYATRTGMAMSAMKNRVWRTDYWRNFIPALEVIFQELQLATIMPWSKFLEFYRSTLKLKFFAEPDTELQAQPFMVHLDANKAASKFIHETLAVMDPQCLTDYRQYSITHCLRQSKHFLMAVPSYRHTLALTTKEKPTVLGLCVYDVTGLSDGSYSPRIHVHSLSILKDCRRNRMATRMIHDLSSRFRDIPMQFIVDCMQCPELACLLKGLGAEITKDDSFLKGSTYRFVLSCQSLMQAEKDSVDLGPEKEEVQKS